MRGKGRRTFSIKRREDVGHGRFKFRRVPPRKAGRVKSLLWVLLFLIAVLYLIRVLD